MIIEFREWIPEFSFLAQTIATFIDPQYQWIDLYSEGISGILTEQSTGWYYKENLGDGKFSPAKLVRSKPSFTGLANGTISLQELEANGKKFLVSLNEGSKGYFECTKNGIGILSACGYHLIVKACY